MRTDINVYAEIIDERVIEDCEINRACDSGLSWLRARPRTLEQLRDYKLDWFKWLAQHTTVPALLEKLSADSNNEVRWCVAQNAHTPVKVLEKLSDDSDNDVRWEAKKNKANRRDCLGKTREA